MEAQVKTKTCFKCKEEQPITEFYVHRRMGDGHLGKCKACTKADVKARRVAEPHKLAAYERKRRADPERRSKQLEYQKTTRANNSFKYHARAMTQAAIRTGRLRRMPCSVCGNDNTEAHHEDYSKPLSVTWLCFVHHMERHGNVPTTDRRHEHVRPSSTSVTVDELAAMADCTKAAIQKDCARGFAPPSIGGSKGHRIYFERAEAEAYAARKRAKRKAK